jgi:predicted TIM-barrel fold metal-dependent hydrolase
MFANTTTAMGVDKIMWSTGFPHLARLSRSHSSSSSKNLKGHSASDQRKIVHDNVARLYSSTFGAGVSELKP